jgi:NAD-dependent deacetylase
MEELFSKSFLSILRRSERVMVSTGAGISAESGVPTFRGPGGLWNDFKPEELATPQAFKRDPKKVWEWYDWRRQLLAKVDPNPGHHALAALEKMVPQFFLFTQNIDGLHQKAGNKTVYELHGSIWQVRCTREAKPAFEMQENPISQLPPICGCGAPLRPNVVWFGENLPPDITAMAWEVAKACDAFFLIGTSATVQPAASLPWVAKENGAIVVEINPEETPATEIADESFRANAGIILPQLVQALKNHHG